MTTAVAVRARRSGAAHPGPPLAAPAIAFAATFLAGVLAGPISGAGPIPSPYKHADVIARYFAASHDATATASWFTLLSASALVFFSAIAFSRLNFLAPNAPGPAIAGFGGIAAAGLLGVSGVVEWVLSRPAVTDQAGLVHALDYLMFISGGPAHTDALGVMVLGLAVTSLYVHRTPRWLAILGIVVGGIDLLASITLLTAAAVPLIPIGRFASLIWIIAISLLLPRDRAARRA
jgi:hypothetical protein